MYEVMRAVMLPRRLQLEEDSEVNGSVKKLDKACNFRRINGMMKDKAMNQSLKFIFSSNKKRCWMVCNLSTAAYTGLTVYVVLYVKEGSNCFNQPRWKREPPFKHLSVSHVLYKRAYWLTMIHQTVINSCNFFILTFAFAFQKN